MASRPWTGWIAGLLPALLGANLALGGAASSPAATAVPPYRHTAVSISSPRESLPLPVHDEATCAFCQAAAFAPHTSSPVAHFSVAPAKEHRVHVTQDDRLTSTASAGPARSRAPPVIRSV